MTLCVRRLNERAVYQRQFLTQIQLVMLLRCESIQFEWASICNLFLDGERASSTPLSPLEMERTAEIACNWSAAVPTTIPDSHTRTHVGSLLSGQTYLLGTQVSNTSLRHKPRMLNTRRGSRLLMIVIQIIRVFWYVKPVFYSRTPRI